MPGNGRAAVKFHPKDRPGSGAFVEKSRENTGQDAFFPADARRLSAAGTDLSCCKGQFFPAAFAAAFCFRNHPIAEGAALGEQQGENPVT